MEERKNPGDALSGAESSEANLCTAVYDLFDNIHFTHSCIVRMGALKKCWFEGDYLLIALERSPSAPAREWYQSLSCMIEDVAAIKRWRAPIGEARFVDDPPAIVLVATPFSPELSRPFRVSLNDTGIHLIAPTGQKTSVLFARIYSPPKR